MSEKVAFDYDTVWKALGNLYRIKAISEALVEIGNRPEGSNCPYSIGTLCAFGGMIEDLAEELIEMMDIPPGHGLQEGGRIGPESETSDPARKQEAA